MWLTVTHSKSRLHQVGQDINLGTEVRCVVEKQLNPKSSCISIGDRGYKNSITYFGILRTNIDLNV